jgi:hypothetical protein
MSDPGLLPSEKRAREYVVTKSDFFGYWVRENDGSHHWPNRGLYLFKWMAVRRARKLTKLQPRVINGDEIVLWESSNG